MRIFIALGSLVAVLLLAILVTPYFVNWTAFRDDFEREASRVLGQPVRVTGEAEARLIPFPSLTFTDVVVGPEGDEPTLTLDRFRMDVELAPFLSGETRIFQMRLEAPHLRLRAGEDGSVATLADLTRSSVVLENVEIADGRISVQNLETGRSREFTAINGRLSARSLAGPFSGSGTLRAQSEPLAYTLSSGAIEESGRWPLRLTLASTRLGADFVFEGATQLSDGEPDFAGRLDIIRRASEGEGALPALRWTSAIDVTRGEALLGDIRLQVGAGDRPYGLTGEGRVDLADIPHFELSLRGEQVNVDALAPEAEGGAGLLGFAERAEAVRATLAAVPSIEIPGRLDLTLPIVTAGDTVLRDLEFRGSPSSQGWSIDRFSAELPGRTLLEGSGLLQVQEELRFAGDLLLAAREPQRFAAWLGGGSSPDLGAVARAGLSATVRLSGDQQLFEELEVDVGGQVLTGTLERSGTPGARAVSADLSGEAADLDRFIAFAELFTRGEDVLEPVDRLDLRLEAGPVRYGALEAETLATDFSFANDLLDLRQFAATGLAGSDIEARGTVSNLFTDPQPDVAIELSSERAAQLIALLAEHWPDQFLVAALARRANALSPLALNATLAPAFDTAGTELVARAEGVANGTRIGFRANIGADLEGLLAGAPFNADLNLESDEPAGLLRQLGFAGLDLGLPSPATLSFALAGNGGEAWRVNLVGEAPGTTLAAEGTARVEALTPGALELSLSAVSDDIAPWLTAAGLSVGQSFDALPVDLAGALSHTDDGWELADIRGDVLGESLAGALRLPDQGPATGELNVATLSLPWLASLVAGADPVSQDAAAGLWSAEPFGGSLLPQQPARIAVAADVLDLGFERELTEFRTVLTLARDAIALENASAILNNGRLSGDARLANAGGFGQLALDLEVEEASIGGADGALAGVLSADMRLEGGGQSFAEIVGNLTGGGTALLRNGVLRGIAADRLPGLLEAADDEAFTAEDASVRTLAATFDQDAELALPDAQTTLSASLGTLTIEPLAVEAESESVRFEGSLDLATLVSSARATLVLEPAETDRIENTAPALTYALEAEGEGSGWVLADVQSLTSFLSLRAYQREQERLEAVREELRESLRLRREARLYRWRAAERERIAAEEAEAERQAALAAEAERQAQEAAARAEAEAAARQQVDPSAAPARTVPSTPQAIDFNRIAPAAEPETGPVSVPVSPSGYDGLPGVAPLPELPVSPG